MTNRKDKGETHWSSVQLAQYRLRAIANLLDTGVQLPTDEKDFLINSLNRIGAGEDPNIVLEVKAGRGERKTKVEAGKLFVRQAAMSWIAQAIKPMADGGLGLSRDGAIEKAAIEFGFTDETLRHWVSHNRKSFKAQFPVPIEYLPIRYPKP